MSKELPEWEKEFDVWCEQLKKYNIFYQDIIRESKLPFKAAWDIQQKKIDQVSKKLDIAIEALEYYSNHEHPRGRKWCQDGGDKAKQALEKIK